MQSHLVRAPLTSIMGLIYLAKETDKNEESFEEILDMLSESAEELDKIILDIAHKTEKLQIKSPRN
ncbi:histidine kinase dimerization/phospho-acceptor domain-containing protein [Salegentibacter salinarum]|nr:histidine kinase dimerization/phospho-acceptor domain-containing protein [Salegentibacter salinarum]